MSNEKVPYFVMSLLPDVNTPPSLRDIPGMGSYPNGAVAIEYRSGGRGGIEIDLWHLEEAEQLLRVVQAAVDLMRHKAGVVVEESDTMSEEAWRVAGEEPEEEHPKAGYPTGIGTIYD